MQPPAGFWDPLGFTKDGTAGLHEARRWDAVIRGRAPENCNPITVYEAKTSLVAKNLENGLVSLVIVCNAFQPRNLDLLLEGGDAASFRRRRYVELKHGRVAMRLA